MIVGMIDSLAFGWSWDAKTGSIKDTQAIGRDIFESMSMGCFEALSTDLIKTQRMLISAITGLPVDLDTALPTGVYDVATDALSPKFQGVQGNIALAVEELAIEMGELRQLIEAGGATGDLEDDLANVWNALTAIANVLGIEVPSPPQPL